uniref:M23ase beta-sheet core domain-containing protein n=1 Tax=candidate division WOR-3 bacterium TaxID=2052148 RepID=A0A7C6E9C1_UNCW3
MARKEVTFVVVPNYQNKSYSKTLSLTLLRFLFVLLCILIIGVGGAIYSTVRFSYTILKMNYLIRRNAQLEAEYAKLKAVKERLARLEAESEKIKNMLGVPKSPPKIDFLSASDGLAETGTLTTAQGTNKNKLDSLSPELANQLTKEKIQYIPAQSPLTSYVISKGFDSTHPGVDLVAPLGTPVQTTADGIIKETGEDSIYGKYVIIEHGMDYTSFYGHLRRTIKNKGDKVKRGDFIGYLGASGKVTAPHLHFEITYKGKKIDPVSFLHLKRARL